MDQFQKLKIHLRDEEDMGKALHRCHSLHTAGVGPASGSQQGPGMDCPPAAAAEQGSKLQSACFTLAPFLRLYYVDKKASNIK